MTTGLELSNASLLVSAWTSNEATDTVVFLFSLSVSPGVVSPLVFSPELPPPNELSPPHAASAIATARGETIFTKRVVV